MNRQAMLIKDSQIRRRGFTLIELLVVISIIALLIGILLPALGAARDTARSAVCLSNLRQVGVGVYAYVQDHDGLLPGAGLNHAGGVGLNEQGSWFFTLSAYADGSLVGRCPSDVSVYWEEVSPTLGRLRLVSYALNNLITGNVPGFEDYRDLDRIARATETIYAVELAEEDPGFAVSDHVHPEAWLTMPPAQRASVVGQQMAIDRHASSSNYLYLDGHAASLDWEETMSGPPFVPSVNHYDPR
ncbi:MAG: prepilin-type N-terminal cleavage/methylation domain-containing protein [Phycisphaeraceae bacterium]